MIFRHNWARLFNNDDQVVALVASVLPLVALFQVSLLSVLACHDINANAICAARHMSLWPIGVNLPGSLSTLRHSTEDIFH